MAKKTGGKSMGMMNKSTRPKSVGMGMHTGSMPAQPCVQNGGVQGQKGMKGK